MLEWLDSLSLAVWLRESPSVWGSATVLTLHTMGMAVLVGASFVLDLRLLGITRNIPLSAFRWVFSAVAVGLAVNLVTGVLLFIKNAATWGTSIPFLIKMSFVIASVAASIDWSVFRSVFAGPSGYLYAVEHLGPVRTFRHVGWSTGGTRLIEELPLLSRATRPSTLIAVRWGGPGEAVDEHLHYRIWHDPRYPDTRDNDDWRKDSGSLPPNRTSVLISIITPSASPM